MPIAAPEHGPSLVDLAGPRLRRTTRRTRVLVAAGVALLVVAVVVGLVARATQTTQVVIHGPLTFNTTYDNRIERVPAGPGELLRLRDRPGRAPEVLVFRDGGPPPRRVERDGAPVAQLALRMAPVMRRIAETTPGYQLRTEGRVKVADLSGWLVRYQYGPAGDVHYGVRAFLMPDVAPSTERVLDMSLRSKSSPVVPNPTMAGSNGPMRTPFYNVAYGTDAP